MGIFMSPFTFSTTATTTAALYYQQQQEQRRLELRDQKDYGNKDDPDRGFWTWVNSINGLRLLQEIQVKTTQIVQQNQQIIALLTRLIDTI
jgi:hypothetical protein